MHGVGPLTCAPTSATFHPAFTHTNGIAGRLGSLVERGHDLVSGALDVWYFVRGLQTNAKPDTLPEKELLSEKRPDKMEYKHFGCRLCK